MQNPQSHQTTPNSKILRILSFDHILLYVVYVSICFIVEDRIYELEAQFGEMVESTGVVINSNKSEIPKFRDRVVKHGLTQRLKGLKDHIDYFSIKDDDVSDFFWNFHDLCNFLDCEFLSFIIKRCGTDELKSQMDEYIRSLEKFCKDVTIGELIKHWNPRFADIPPEISSCVCTFDWDPTTTKVIDLKKIQHKITKKLPQELAMAAFVVYDIKPSSVTIIWLLWTKFLPQIRESLETFFESTSEFLSDSKILYFSIDDAILYSSYVKKVCIIHNSWHQRRIFEFKCYKRKTLQHVTNLVKLSS